MEDAQNSTFVNVPTCSQQTHSSQYSSVDASKYTPDHGDYYRGKLPTMLPGAIVGVICLIAASLFLVWVSECLSEMTLRRQRVGRGTSAVEQVTLLT